MYPPPGGIVEWLPECHFPERMGTAFLSSHTILPKIAGLGRGKQPPSRHGQSHSRGGIDLAKEEACLGFVKDCRSFYKISLHGYRAFRKYDNTRTSPHSILIMNPVRITYFSANGLMKKEGAAVGLQSKKTVITEDSL